jgi:hypothetical protein
MNQFRFSFDSLESVPNGARNVGFEAKTILFSFDSPQNRNIVVCTDSVSTSFLQQLFLIILFKYNNLEYIVFKLFFVKKFRILSKHIFIYMIFL